MFEYNFELLANYNKITNELMNDIIKNISEEEWNKISPTFFKSIHEICSHIYICDFNWLKRFKGLRDFDILNKNIFERNYSFTETIFSDINEYIFMRTELDKILIEFINELRADDLEKILKFTDSKGSKIEKRMDILLIHVFNHETHHRGMISVFLEMLGKENDYSSIIYKKEL